MVRHACFIVGVVALFGLGLAFQTRADLALHYAFEGDYTDKGPSGNVATPTNGIALTTVATNVMAGVGAVKFDGADYSYLMLSNTTVFTASAPWSVAFWARRAETSTSKGMVIGARGDSNNFIWLADGLGTGKGLRFRPSSGGSYDYNAPRDLNPHHFALIADGSGTLSLYVDGSLSETKTSVATSFQVDTIGQAYTPSSHYAFKGLLDDVRVYSHALDAGTVSNLFRLGSTVRYTFEGNLSDSGMTTNTGTASGSAAVVTTPASVLAGSGSLLLDGADASYVALSNTVAFEAADTWSVAFWARRGDATGDTGMVVGRRGTDSDYIWLNTSQAGFRFCPSAGAASDFSTPKDTDPHHYALVASGGGALSLYVDGMLATNVSGADTGFAVDTIGQAYPTDSTHYAFKGVLDDVVICPDALDLASIRLPYKQGAVLSLHFAFEGDFKDSGVFGNDGIPDGNALVTNSSEVALIGSGALLLDGSDRSNVRLTSAISFASGAPWSVAFWAQRGEAGGSLGMVMGKNQTTSDFIWLNDSFSGFRFRSSASATVDFVAPTDMAPHHFALVSEGDSTLSLYIDGLLASNTAASTTSFTIDTVGQAYTTNTLHYGFKGVLDDVRIYNYALSAATVDAMAEQGDAGILHFAFDGDFTDSSESGNDGTANGAAAITTVTNAVAVGTGALALDGADASSVSLSSPISFTNGAAWSVAFWACRGETGASKGMVLGEANTFANFIWLNDSFSGLRFRSSTSNTVDFVAPKDLVNHHYALVSTGSGPMRLYVDGVLSETKTAVTNSFFIDTVGQAYLTSSHIGFKGVLDDLRVYPYALSAYRVAALYQRGTVEAPAPATVTRVHVFLQGGQSNSEGRADPAQLPTSPVNLQGHQSDVDFYYLSVLNTLYPATTSGTQFGPEITFGRHLVDLMQPDASNRVAIIKYSVGGTSLYNDWKAGGDATISGDQPLYVNFQAMVTSGLAALAARYPDAEITIEGMIWMQGESDVNATYSPAYYTNLKTFIADVRLTYGLPQLPFVVGRLSSSQTGAGSVTYLNAVRQAQTAVAAEDPWTGLVNTDDFSLKTDNLHFDAAGQQALGIAFAERLLILTEERGTFIRIF